MSLDTRASTVTIDTNEWKYQDVTGVEHIITNGQTFVLKSVDDSVTGYVQYYILPATTSMTTTDGLKIKFASGEVAQGPQGFLMSSTFTAASVNHKVSWTLPMICPVTGVIQYWKVSACTMSDLDFSSAGTMGMTMTDQFGNEMVLSGITVGQAA